MTAGSPVHGSESGSSTPKKPLFVCVHPGCTKRFTRRDYLERHTANHTGVKSHQCNICFKSYARADVLRRHVANHPTKRTSTTPVHTPLPTDTNKSGLQTENAPFCSAPNVTNSPSNMLSDITAQPFASTSTIVPMDNSNLPFNDLYTWLMDYQEPTLGITEDNATSTIDSLPEDWLKAFGLDEASTTLKQSSERLINTYNWQQAVDLVTGFGVKIPSEGFSESDFNKYLELYFLHFDPLYSILHRPTLSARSCPLILLLSIICLGSIFSVSRLSKDFLSRVQAKLRARIFDMIELETRINLQAMQALFLITYLGRTYCDTHQHDLSQVYFSASVTVAQLGGVFSSSTAKAEESGMSVETQWHAWAEEEERIRLAWMIFACDTFSSAFLRNSVMLQCGSVGCPLPCQDRLWQASTVSDWANQMPESPSDSVMTMKAPLQRLLDEATLADDHTSYGLWILLHALQSLTWALSAQGQDGFTLVRREQVMSWKRSIFHALSRWHQHAISPLGVRIESAFGLNVHAYAGAPLCGVCIIALLTDLDSVRILAGALHLNGRVPTSGDRAAARSNLQPWARSADGRQSCYYAIEMLHLVLRWINPGEISAVPPTTLWSAYIGSLVMWAYTAMLNDLPMNDNLQADISPNLRCRVEPTLARRAAQEYLERLLACGDPVNLPALLEIKQVTTVIAYVAHLCGAMDWGMLTRPTRVLYGLLRNAENVLSSIYVDC